MENNESDESNLSENEDQGDGTPIVIEEETSSDISLDHPQELDLKKEAKDTPQNQPRLLSEIAPGSEEIHPLPAPKPCPQSVGAPNVMRMFLEWTGEDIGGYPLNDDPLSWKLSSAYIHYMGVSGEAFRMWDSLYYEGPDAIDQMFLKMFESAGYSCRMIRSNVYREAYSPKGESWRDQEDFMEILRRHLDEEKRPAILFSCSTQWPDWRLITGYGQETLIGYEMSAYPLDTPENPASVYPIEDLINFHADDAQPTLLILPGHPIKKPNPQLLDRQSLEQALNLLKTNQMSVRPNEVSNTPYESWMEVLSELDGNDKQPGEALLRGIYANLSKISSELAERRWYARHFLNETATRYPHLERELNSAAENCKAVHDAMYELWGMLGGMRQPDSHLKLADKQTRHAIIRIIRRVEALDKKTVRLLERILKKF